MLDDIPTHYVRKTGRNADGTRWWTNVAYNGSTCLGGDAHWLSEALADEALDKLMERI